VLGTNPEGIRLLLPSKLPMNPMSLACPLCGAPPGRDCKFYEGSVVLVHVDRFKAALVRATVPDGTKCDRKLESVTQPSLGYRAYKGSNALLRMAMRVGRQFGL
jgi:hypothetical protein